MAGTSESLEEPSATLSPEPKSAKGFSRFLSTRKARETAGHRRSISKDTLGEKGKDSKHVVSVVSLSAAFPSESKKTLPMIGIFLRSIHGTNANTGSSQPPQSRVRNSDGFFSSIFKSDKVEEPKKADAEVSSVSQVQTEDAQIQEIKNTMIARGYNTCDDEQVKYAMSMVHGDAKKALEMMFQFQRSVEGAITPYSPDVVMLGAENRQQVTCWLDSLLFAMFARSSNFEHMIRTGYDDDPRRRLSTVIRLWVNMLREGELINVEITRILQESIAISGWEDAARAEQQDVCEAFGFLTDKLDLPLMKLKMDLYHPGAEDQDDHKFVEERFLAIAVPDEVESGERVKLEDCLEGYFNNQIEVNRDLSRINTKSSVQSFSPSSDEKTAAAQHIEEREIPRPNLDSTTSRETLKSPTTPSSEGELANGTVRHVDDFEEREDAEEDSDSQDAKSPRKGSKAPRQIPAWQFFNLIPWTTRSTNNGGDASMTEHLLETLPQLAICLKRYGMENGKPFRKNTLIDIPLEFRIPHFADEPLVPQDARDKFKLVLQSVVCHRGVSVQSGHYVSMIRGGIPPPDGDSGSTRELSNDSMPPDYAEERWFKHDDMATPRVAQCDIHEELDREMPYLLFYQIQPIEDVPVQSNPVLENGPPTYTASAEQSTMELNLGRQANQVQGYFDDASEISIPSVLDPTPTIRFSTELDRSSSIPGQLSNHSSEERRGSAVFTEDRRGSLALTDISTNSVKIISAPGTPNEETTGQRMSRAASRFTKSSSKSRPTSQSGENKISAFSAAGFGFSRAKKSKDNLRMDKDTKEPSPRKSSIIAMTREASPRKGSVIAPGSVTATPRPSITIEEPERPSENSLRSPEHAGERSKSRIGRKRDKSKGPPSEKSDPENHHHLYQHHSSKVSKSKDGNEENERECRVM